MDYDKIYDDFLYDCYCANKRLSDGEWYGEEDHHPSIKDAAEANSLNRGHLCNVLNNKRAHTKGYTIRRLHD